MRIDHLIDGRAVAGRDYFETVNPATQEVLDEVASGGEAEVHAAVAAAKTAWIQKVIGCLSSETTPAGSKEL